MSELIKIEIGPPKGSVCEGMNTTFRRQQLPPNYYRMLRNVKASREAIQKIGGRVRVAEGDLPAKSLTNDGNNADFITVPYTDTTAITDYKLGAKWSLFVAYSFTSLATDNYIAGQGTDPTGTPPWWLRHKSTGEVEALVTDADGTTLTLATTKTYTQLGTEMQVLLSRNKDQLLIKVGDDTAVTGGGLSATALTEQSTDDIYVAGYSGAGNASPVTMYETRLFRRASTSTSWRMTQYPWTGRFGDPDSVLHLVYEDGSGTSLTDYSRINNETIALSGSWTWNSSTLRQTVAPVTGIHITGNVRGRRWMLVAAGKNHYRIPLN